MPPGPEAMADSSDLAILVVTHDSRPHLEALFRSLAEHAPQAQVVVVDNASADDSPGLAQQICPAATVVRSPENLGFAAGCNLAARQAARPYLLLLNADTVLLAPLDPALELLHNRPDAGAIGARMLGRDLEYRFSCGSFPWFHRLVLFSRLYRRDGAFGRGDFAPGAAPVPVDWVEGSFLLTRSELWSRLGGLDEGYFMYVEDVDYCRRAARAGFATLYHPGLAYRHLGGYSPARHNLLVKGFRRFNARHAGALGSLAATLVLDAGLVARLALSGLLSLASKPGQAAKFTACLHALLDR